MPLGYGHDEDVEVQATARRFSPREEAPHPVWPGETLIPDNDSLVPMMEAFARACLQISTLKSAELSTMISVCEDLDTDKPVQRCSPWGVWYFSPGTSPCLPHKIKDFALSTDISQRRLFWYVKDWNPDYVLQCLLRNLGCDKYGVHLVERFIDV